MGFMPRVVVDSRFDDVSRRAFAENFEHYEELARTARIDSLLSNYRRSVAVGSDPYENARFSRLEIHELIHSGRTYIITMFQTDKPQPQVIVPGIYLGNPSKNFEGFPTFEVEPIGDFLLNMRISCFMEYKGYKGSAVFWPAGK